MIDIHCYQSNPTGGWLAVYPLSLEPWKGNAVSVEVGTTTHDIVDLVAATATTEGWAHYDLIFHHGQYEDISVRPLP